LGGHYHTSAGELVLELGFPGIDVTLVTVSALL
jgi:hypothetical protein